MKGQQKENLLFFSDLFRFFCYRLLLIVYLGDNGDDDDDDDDNNGLLAFHLAPSSLPYKDNICTHLVIKFCSAPRTPMMFSHTGEDENGKEPAIKFFHYHYHCQPRGQCFRFHSLKKKNNKKLCMRENYLHPS
ncbi:unnamed protein product [Lota lota]